MEFTRYCSERALAISDSITVGLADIVTQLNQAGENVIGLNEGELDFDTPSAIIKSTQQALSEGLTKYSWLNGEQTLRQEVCRKLKDENGIFATEDEILIGNGSKQVIFELISTIVDAGDEVIIPVPCWATYIECVKLAGGKPILVDTIKNTLNLDLIRNHTSERTKLIILNTPNNPSGEVYDRKVLQDIAKFVDEKKILLLSDEAYEKFVFDGEQHHSCMALHPSKYIITAHTFSKAYSMTGFRVGYIHADKSIIDRVSSLHGHLTDNVCTFAQYGAIAALRLPESILAERLEILESRRRLAIEKATPLFEFEVPKGAFYLFLNVEKYLTNQIQTSVQLCEYLLVEAKVALIPGEACHYPGYVRLAYAADNEVISEAFERIEKALNKLGEENAE